MEHNNSRATDTPTAPGNGFVAVPEELDRNTAQTPTLSKSSARAREQWLVVLVMIISDSIFAALFWVLAFVIYSILVVDILSYLTFSLIIFNVVAWIVTRALVGLYPGYRLSSAEELRRQTYATVTALAVTTLVAFGAGVESNQLPILLLALSFLQRLLLAPLARYCVKCGLRKIGLWGKPVVVIGAGETGQRLLCTLKEDWGLGFRPVAVFDNHIAPIAGRVEGVPYGGSLSNAMPLAEKYGIDTAIFATPHIRRENLAKLVNLVRHRFRHVIVIPNLGGITNSAVVARDFSGTFGVEIKHNLLDPWAQRAKRALDIGATAAGAVFVLPLISVLYVLVLLESGRPVFYAADRIGRDGKLFPCFKFRTMVKDAEELLQRILAEDEDAREQYLKYHKLREDPRVTRIGHFLRKTSLDELPQLWNVVRGEMSLVGPRPYLSRESKYIGAPQSEILRVAPGITGPWQVSGRNHTSFSERVSMDACYVHNWSVWHDLVLLSRTMKILIFKSGAY